MQIESQRNKYLTILSNLSDSNKVIATEYWPSFMTYETQLKILSIQEVLKTPNFSIEFHMS